MKRVQITRALNKPSIRFVPVFLLPFLSLSSKIKNLLFSSKENLLTFLHAETKRTKREKRNEGGGKGEETPLSPSLPFRVGSPIGP